jgi:hypothetical protein
LGAKIEDPFVMRAFEILQRFPTLGKTREEGLVLASNAHDLSPKVASEELISALHSSSNLDQSNLAELIVCLDLLASGLPDNSEKKFDPEIQQLGGKLRQRYSKLYGGSPYDKSAE